MMDCSPGSVSPVVNGRLEGPDWVGLSPGLSVDSRLRPQSICEEILSSRLFSGCSALVDASSYVQACRHDLCACEHANPSSCICHTLAEYSRQCAHAGGLPLDWRGPDLCRECPSRPRPRRVPALARRRGQDMTWPRTLPCSPDLPPQHAVSGVWLALRRHLLQPRALPALRGPLHGWLLLPRG